LAEKQEEDWKALFVALAVVCLLAFLAIKAFITKGGLTVLLASIKWAAFTAIVTAGGYFTVLIVCGGSALYNYGTKPGDERGCAGMAALIVFGICVWKGLFG
jgi:hypothetical protein